VAFTLHRASGTDRLAEGLADLLSTPLDDPFAMEVVVVAAKGTERWVAQRLSHRLGVGPRGSDGVCAGVRFLSPTSLVSLLLDRGREDPWDPDRLVWPVLQAIDSSLEEPWARPLARHLGHDRDGQEGELRANRRYAVARHLASLYWSYSRQRPQLITDWSQGRPTDGLDADLPPALRWQAELWPRIVDLVDAPPPDVRWRETVRRLAEGGAGLDLPGRVSLFGHTRLPAGEVALLAALGRLRDVHLWLSQAFADLWADLAPGAAEGPVRRRVDDSDREVGHPLLASLGRDARELQRTLAPVVERDELLPTTARSPRSLLGLLQDDLRANRAPSVEERAARADLAGDGSVQVHACHGPHRQVEVLREVLVGLLQDDPTLEPRDIVVMCPDVETYAPLIEADFGLGEVVPEGHPAHGLRVRLADRALSSTNPLLALAARVVELAGGRVRASDVLDLLATEPVRRRFGFDDTELARITGWVDDAGVRWGLDPEQRTGFAMQAFGHNTWRAGLDRVLLGVAMSGDGLTRLGPALPLDDVGSSDIDLVGRFTECLARVDAAVRSLTGAAFGAEWADAVRESVRSLGAVDPLTAWQEAEFEREIATSFGEDAESVLRLADVRALLQGRTGGRPTRANFRTGTLTVCTMVPMRSVPHRVVCLVGLDDGDFPRTQATDGDDVLARDPMTGERDVRSEDRQLLLDALLAAGDTFVVCYTGADEHTGAKRPPAVPLGELIDAVAMTADGADVVRRHPLQTYDPANLAAPSPFSFDRAALAGARAAFGPREPVPAFVPVALPARPRGDVSLADLKRFFTHPVREFCRQRLQIGTSLEAEEIHDGIPVSLGALDKWAMGDRFLTLLLAGETDRAVFFAELLRGTVPPGRLGEGTVQEIVVEVQALLDQTTELRTGTPRTVDVEVDLGSGRRLTGTVSGVLGSRIVALHYSRLAAKHRLPAWIDLLALSAARPDESWTAHTVGRSKAGPTRALVAPLDHRAREWLLELVELYDEGLTRPLPAPIKTAHAWAETHVGELMGAPGSAREAADRAWTTDPFNPWGIPGEDADPWHERVFGRSAPLSALVGIEDVAWRIWEPLVTGAERVGPL
jgi:exodeoxyribonuclease V gamma subunit